MAEPTFKIERYVPADKPGKYDTEVQALIAEMESLTEEDMEENGVPSVVVNFPKEDSKGKDQVAKYKRYFQDSAKRFNRTAREVAQDDQGDGSVNVRFILTSKVLRPRKPKDEAGSEVPATSDTPTVEKDAA